MRYDEGRLEELIEESADLQTDGMKSTRGALDDLVEITKDQQAHADPDEARDLATDRRPLVGTGAKLGGALAAGAVGVGALGMVSAFAQGNVNVQALQTSASIENLAVFSYGKALGLPYIANGNAVIKAFAMKTMQQHAAHAQAFNAAATKLGGKAQMTPDPVLAPQVMAMLPALVAATTTTGPPMVVALATTLERTASETYSKNCQLMNDLPSRSVMSSILGIDSQHLAVLLAVSALLKGGAPQLVAIPTNDAALPAAAGSAGFPDTFFPNDPKFARPPEEGAIA